MSKQKLALDNSQVPEGYKKTDIGVIPEDWEVEHLKNALKQNPQYGINAPAVPYRDNLPVYIRITDISEDGYFAPDNLVSVNQENSDRYYLEEGDLVFARTGASVGKSYLYNLHDGELVFAGFLIRIRPDENILLPHYLSQYVKTKAYWDWVKLMSMRSGQPGINGNEYGQLLVPLPAIEEQRAIAQTLSDVDGLIAALDKAIAKKRNIKTATMQELLTGKKRLPGFYGEWEMKLLGEMGVTYGGLNGKTKADFGTGSSQYIPFLNIINNVVVDPYEFKRVKVSISENQNEVKMGDLFFNGSSETPEEVGMCAVLLKKINDVYLNSFCFGFRLREDFEADGLFLAYFFRSNEGRKLLYTLAQGTTRYNLSKTNFMKLKFKIPTLQEQRAIASILSDMDAEIAALEKRRAKTQAMKQGMMQELLTGKTRLIVPNNP